MKKCDMCGEQFSEETENGLCPDCVYWEEYSTCHKCNRRIDCECMGCHYCSPEFTCETCGACHIDGWEAVACWSMENDPDYDPMDI